MSAISGIPSLDWRIANDIVLMARVQHGLEGCVTGHMRGTTVKLFRAYEGGIFDGHVMTIEVPKVKLAEARSA